MSQSWVAPRALTTKCVDVVQTLNTPLTDFWTDKLESGQTDAFAAVLIAHLTKIRRLTVTGHYLRWHDLIGPVLELKMSGQLPKFERLKLLTYFQGHDSYNFPLMRRVDDVMRLFYIPTVRHLAVWMGHLQREPYKWLSGKPDLRNLTFLAIEGCHAATMGEILALSKNLKSLAWSWEYATRTSDSFMTKILDLDEIITALSHVKNTLERLQLRINTHTKNYYSGEREINVMGSFSGLRDFNRITDLEVPLIFLAGCGDQPQPLDHCTPSSIKTLSPPWEMLLNVVAVKWIPGDDEPSGQEILKLVQDMSKNSSTSLPQLQRISIFDVDDWVDKWQFFEMFEEFPLDVEFYLIPRFPQLWDFCT